MNKKIIAILGLPGSGKTEAIDYLMSEYNWPKVYFGDVTFDEIKNRGLAINEANERIVREDLRKKYGRLHYAEKVIKKIEAIDNKQIILVESLYDWAEYILFKEKFKDDFITLAIYASPKKRYSRLKIRKIRPLTPEEAQSRDYAQIENISQAGPIAMADYTIINNQDGLENLHKQLSELIESLSKP
jgi:dephospho-CoA kinase